MSETIVIECKRRPRCNEKTGWCPDCVFVITGLNTIPGDLFRLSDEELRQLYVDVKYRKLKDL